MQIQGVDLVDAIGQSPLIKAVFNNRGIIFFPASQQHRDQKAPGISYEDDYEGNALAAVIQNGKIEIRYHARFSAEQVTAILKSLREHPELSVLQYWTVTYKGIALDI